MGRTWAEVGAFTDERAARIEAASKRSKAQQARLQAMRLRLIAHFDRIDAHLARTHSYLNDRYGGLDSVRAGTPLRDAYVAAGRAPERQEDAGHGQAPV